MADELVDIFDENYRKVGSELRSEAIAKGHWLRSFHCWIVRRGEPNTVLFQKRGHAKNLFPDYLDVTAAGHLRAGESVDAGVREIKEELGLTVSRSDLWSLGVKIDVAKLGEITNRQFCHVFLLESKRAPEEFDLDGAEVEGLVEISVDAGLSMFSGQGESAPMRGIEYRNDRWEHIHRDVTHADFIPRVDSYYYKIFIIARGYLRGDEYLCI